MAGLSCVRRRIQAEAPGYTRAMRKTLTWVLLLGSVSLASACPVKAGTFANGTLKSIPAGLKPECGILYRLMKSGITQELGAGSWFELYSSAKPVALGGLESAVAKQGYTSVSNVKEAKDSVATLQNEFRTMIGKDARTEGRFLVGNKSNRAIMLLQIGVPGDNLIIVAAMPTN